MIRMFPRRRSQVSVPVGEDKVLFGVSLPSESRLNGLTAEVHIGAANVIAATVALMYGIEGYILPVLDPDSGATLDTLWDTLVPKDDDVDTIDLDTAGSDTQSMFEPGESSMAEVMNVGLQPERIYSRQALRTFANGALRQEEGGVLEWALADVLKLRISKNYFIEQPSVVLFAVGSPDLLDTDINVPTILAENEWPRVKFMETVLEQALMKLMGLVESTAETPWEEAAALLRKFLEPDVHEIGAGSWGASVLNVFSNATFDVSVVGSMGKMQLGTGG